MFENPHAPDNVHVRLTRYRFPSIIINKGIKLIGYGMVPNWSVECFGRLRGNGSKGAEVWRFNGCLGLELPVMLRVCMVWLGGSGGGGGGLGVGEVDGAVGCGETGC